MWGVFVEMPGTRLDRVNLLGGNADFFNCCSLQPYNASLVQHTVDFVTVLERGRNQVMLFQHPDFWFSYVLLFVSIYVFFSAVTKTFGKALYNQQNTMCSLNRESVCVYIVLMFFCHQCFCIYWLYCELFLITDKIKEMKPKKQEVFVFSIVCLFVCF